MIYCPILMGARLVGTMGLMFTVTRSPSRSRKRKRRGVIFPSVSVQEIICMGVLSQRYESTTGSSFLKIKSNRLCQFGVLHKYFSENGTGAAFGHRDQRIFCKRLIMRSFPLGTLALR